LRNSNKAADQNEYAHRITYQLKLVHWRCPGEGWEWDRPPSAHTNIMELVRTGRRKKQGDASRSSAHLSRLLRPACFGPINGHSRRQCAAKEKRTNLMKSKLEAVQTIVLTISFRNVEGRNLANF
jgi:hypothetical protein